MSIVERDMFLRMIRQLAEALGRVLGLRKAGKLDEAQQELDATANAAFGPLLSTLERLTPEAAAMMLGRKDKIEAYASITREQAEIAAARGSDKRAKALFARADALMRAPV